ncbi:PLAC8 family-domain-containing protein [Achaetomium macrosporum]|uniref:PLAC8 family-domain-containing protein n=1 Tax=Achaetomium macrosporum TaxID=79813 RepID=A0AAN7H771_9PEZI|nr:PLAC8 family-domain-containing protein [Achaetomium macrosporum]
MSHIKEHEWQDGLCSFCDGGHCMMGCFCPCILVNKTHELLEDPHKQDPSGCGGVGCGWCLLNMCGGWGFIVGLMQRNKIRDKYRIEGGICGDIMTNLCCPCCSVIQQYKEVEMRRDAAGPSKMGYQAQAPMHAPGH